MKTIKQIKDEVVGESYFRNGKPMKFSDLWESYPEPSHIIDEVAKRCAAQEAIEFTNWITKGYMKWGLGWMPIYGDLKEAHKLWKTTEELYKIWKDGQ